MYRIIVTLNGAYFFKIEKDDMEDAVKVYQVLEEKFTEKEGYAFHVTHWPVPYGYDVSLKS